MLKNRLLSLLTLAGIGSLSPAFGGMSEAKPLLRKDRRVRWHDRSAPRYYSGAKLARKAAAGKIGKAVLR